ncbi:hypothetical protein SAMN05192550_0864 [Flavobacterium glycines]|uniref:Uncharacterized protein n=1 Tax=Flavobacterium glycines TaxID=551990 RepID=A0A1B9DSH4_9FLAO|nr:hypothetical protein [Flavobacterium glycines]OCB72614.1 hypothetical protein FBGL_08230 [Flavobacterium glycines]GEL10113.1 hypothetical protein FGL01_08520 [Flavobacterium glycines]SDI80956.1 hypothetical protein SAMN05192550_0864 [Flavobacterium glycines]
MKGIKKHRGLKRYYKKLATENDLNKATWLDFDNPENWFDNWHLHFDNKGYGNDSFKRRKPHLDKLFRHFDLLVDKTKRLKTEFQLYSIILDFDSYSDALFLHTPNPNNTQFPFKILDLQSTTTLKNKELNEYINNLDGYEKLYGKADEAFCLIFKKNVGQPF